ncbi:MAG: hypothetical protein Q9162_004660 [Coniocarpon cinnabarinum]
MAGAHRTHEDPEEFDHNSSSSSTSPELGLNETVFQDIKAENERIDQPDEARRTLSRTTTSSSAGRNLIAFETDDPGQPYNWSQTKKVAIVVVGAVSVINSTIASSIPSGDLGPISRRFGVSGDEQQVLPNSIFLLGYVFGPLLFSPLSESYGRQIIFAGTFVLYYIFTIATPFSPNWAAFLVIRLIAGTFACSPISVIGGIYADLYNDPISRGRAMALFMTATTWGPVGGPVISGYLSTYSWRWPFWFMVIFGGASLIPVCLIPETYGPVVLQRRARYIRKHEPGAIVWAPIDFEKSTWHDLFVTFLGRPFRMIATEPLVFCTCAFMAFIYGNTAFTGAAHVTDGSAGIFYVLLIAYPQIFPPVYGFSLGQEGLAFVPIGIGALFACAIYLWWDHYLRMSKAKGKPWAQSEEFRRLPLACLGGPFLAAACFWVGWAAQPQIHWIVPVLAGIPFGIGYLLLFMSLLNYIVDAYEIFAASALAGAACTRSLFGVVLPFATTPMYTKLGIQWACSLLGFIGFGFCIIPFLFLKYGDRIRSKSKFCQELAEKRRVQQEKDEKRRLRQQRRRVRESQDAEKLV